MKLCTVCGVATSRAGSRCTEHARQSNRSRHNALYSARAWQRLSARVLRAWRGERGNWCPGYQRDAHVAADLTVDHVTPLAAGGAPFDIANTSVPAEYYRLRKLSRVVAWFRTAGLDLAKADVPAIVDFVRQFKTSRPVRRDGPGD